MAKMCFKIRGWQKYILKKAYICDVWMPRVRYFLHIFEIFKDSTWFHLKPWTKVTSLGDLTILIVKEYLLCTYYFCKVENIKQDKAREHFILNVLREKCNT